MKYFLLLILALAACQQVKEQGASNPSQPADAVLNEWHKAAANGEYGKYFELFSDSSAIFMGTDATERWTMQEFATWAKPAFEDGEAWSFTPFNRYIYYSQDSTMAWFDEELDTPNMGLCRGSGVLKVVEGKWKIAHYNLTMPVPNEILYEVRDQIKALDTGSNTD